MSDHRARAREPVAPLVEGEAEVHQDRAARAVDHDVARLEVAVDDPALVDGLEAGAHLPAEGDGLPGREVADGLDQVVERLALDELHADVEGAVHLAEVVDAADVGMGDGLSQGQFAPEPLARQALAGGGRPYELERHRLAELAVDRLVDVPHAPGADLLDDRVAVAEGLARRELCRRPGQRGLDRTDGRHVQLAGGGSLRRGRTAGTGGTERPVGHCLGAALNAVH